MGCDIHDYVEVRTGGVWRKVGPIFPHPYHREGEPSDRLLCWVPEAPSGERFVENYHPSRGEKCNEECHVSNPRKCDHPFKRRNYDVFAMLANVRNGRGFAGCDTGDGFVPISEPRGLPDDVTPEVRAESDKWGGDGHSHSWLTLAELLAYDWNQTTRHRGWVDADEYKAFKEDGRPKSWCGGVSGSAVRHVSHQEMEQRIADGGAAHCYTLVEWEESYAVSAAAFLEKTIPALRELGAPEDVRLVFWFDN